MTAFRALKTLCGLSNREAAALLDISVKTVENMHQGRSRMPPGVRADMLDLAARIAGMADAMLAEIVASDVERVELAAPRDDDDAERLAGLPSMGAWMAMAGRVVAESDIPVDVVPSGSTPAVAAARKARP